MVEEAAGPVAFPCVECGRPPVVAFELTRGKFVNLCLQHYQAAQAIREREIVRYGELADRAEDDMADAFGVPRTQRPARIPAARINVHQVNIHGDNLGVVNTGTVGSIATNLSIINRHDAALSGQLKALTEAVLASKELDDTRKREAADLLSEVVEDAAKPLEKRRSRVVMGAIGTGLGRVLSVSADLHTLWAAIAPGLFG